MSTLSVQIPNSLHAHLQELAEREGISVEQFIDRRRGEDGGVND